MLSERKKVMKYNMFEMQGCPHKTLLSFLVSALSLDHSKECCLE